MSDLSLIYGPNSKIAEIYGFEPGQEIYNFISSFAVEVGCDNDMINRINYKVQNYAKKLYMMHTAVQNALEKERDFMSTQNREFVCLIWTDEIELLYHTEAAILFGRSALDITAYILAIFTLEPFETRRIDSFNEYSKKLLKSSSESNKDLREYILRLEENEFAWYRILCGKEKGRAERDKIVHQTTSRIEYHEISKSSDKEYCHYIIGEYAVPFEEFLKSITHGIFDFIRIAEKTISKNYITTK